MPRVASLSVPVRSHLQDRGLRSSVCREALYRYAFYIFGGEIYDNALLVVAFYLGESFFAPVGELCAHCEVFEGLRLRTLYHPLYKSGFKRWRKQPRTGVNVQYQPPDFLRGFPFKRKLRLLGNRRFPAVVDCSGDVVAHSGNYVFGLGSAARIARGYFCLPREVERVGVF